jgi:predicted nucleic acid-binding protein
MIVADTGPLNYLIQIKQADLLPLLFGQVFIPFEVQEELQRERTPIAVREWLATPPSWLVLLGPGPRVVTGTGLHPGELAAMDLAERLGHQTLLIDDQRGKLEAVRRGLPVIGSSLQGGHFRRG